MLKCPYCEATRNLQQNLNDHVYLMHRPHVKTYTDALAEQKREQEASELEEVVNEALS